MNSDNFIEDGRISQYFYQHYDVNGLTCPTITHSTLKTGCEGTNNKQLLGVAAAG